MFWKYAANLQDNTQDFNKVALETVIVKTVLILMKKLQGENMITIRFFQLKVHQSKLI